MGSPRNQDCCSSLKFISGTTIASKSTIVIVLVALLVATPNAQLDNGTLQQLRQLCTTSYSGCTLSWSKASSTLFSGGDVQKQMGELHDGSLMCLLSASTSPTDGSDTLITQTCTNSSACEQVALSIPSNGKTYTAKLCMYRGHADTFLSEKQLVSNAAQQSPTASVGNTAKQCMLKYLQKAGQPLSQGSPALNAALRAILHECWLTSYGFVAAAKTRDPAFIKNLLDSMRMYDDMCTPAAAPLPAPAGSSAPAANALEAALKGADDACSRSFLQQMPELRPDITLAYNTSCGVTVLQNLDNCCETYKEPLNLSGKDLRGTLPANFTMAPMGTVLFNNPYLCGGLQRWPSKAALNTSGFAGGNYSSYDPAEAVLLWYLQQNSTQLVYFGLYNSKVTLEMDALSAGAPYYFSAVVMQHLGRGFMNANNLQGLPTPEQGVLACQLLGEVSEAVTYACMHACMHACMLDKADMKQEPCMS
jgi:hypothetical protein